MPASRQDKPLLCQPLPLALKHGKATTDSAIQTHNLIYFQHIKYFSLDRTETPAPENLTSRYGPLSILVVDLCYFSLVGLGIHHTGQPCRGFLRISGSRTIVTDAEIVAFSLLAAVLCWEFVKRPIGRLKDAFKY